MSRVVVLVLALGAGCTTTSTTEPDWLAAKTQALDAHLANRVARFPLRHVVWNAIPAGAIGDAPPVDGDGYDASTLATRYPTGAWLPLVDGGARGQLDVLVQIDGHDVIATLDTGAATSVVPAALARSLRLPRARADDDKAKAARAGYRDAEGAVGAAEIGVIDELRLGRHTFGGVTAMIIEDAGAVLIGYDVLSDLDVVVAVDDGTVGLFDPGTGPIFEGARTFSVRDAGSALFADVAMPRADGGVFECSLTVDTGAVSTALPVPAAINAGVPVDLHASTVSMSSVTGRNEHRGRFAPTSLWLGPEAIDAGPLAAFDTTGETGLLGGDVLFTHRTLISAKRHLLALSPARWPQDGRRTVSVSIVSCKPETAEDGAFCLHLLSGVTQPVSFDVRFFDDAGRAWLAGGAVRINAWSAKAREWPLLHLPKSLDGIGFDDKTHVSLRVRRTLEREGVAVGNMNYAVVAPR